MAWSPSPTLPTRPPVRGWIAKPNLSASGMGIGTADATAKAVLTPSTVAGSGLAAASAVAVTNVAVYAVGDVAAAVIARAVGAAAGDGDASASAIRALFADASGLGVADAAAATMAVAAVTGMGVADAATAVRQVLAAADGSGIPAAVAAYVTQANTDGTGAVDAATVGRIVAAATGIGDAAATTAVRQVLAAATAVGTPNAAAIIRAVAGAVSASGTPNATTIVRQLLAAADASGAPSAAARPKATADAAGTGTPDATAQRIDAPTTTQIIGAAAAHATSIAIPAHAIGDEIQIYAYNASVATAPGKPSSVGTVPAWQDVLVDAGANTNAARLVRFVATATNHTSGTFTNTSDLVAVVLRNQHRIASVGGTAAGGTTSTSPVVAPAVTMVDTVGASALLHYFGRRASTGFNAWSAPPAGYTQRAAVVNSTGVALISKDVTTSDGSVSQGENGTVSIGYRGATIEVVSAATTRLMPDSIGVGGLGLDGGTSCGWAHETFQDGDVFVTLTSYGAVAPTTATFDGAPMTPIGNIADQHRLYRVSGVAAGVHNVAFAYLNTMRWASGNSIAYPRVGSVSAPVTISGSNSGVTSQGPVALSATQTALWVFGGWSGVSTDWSAPAGGGNTRALLQNANAAANIIRDAYATTTFTASSPTFANYAAMYVVLSP